VARLVTVKGIGRWSAEIYLLSALGRPDVWPADDLALMLAVQRLKRLQDRPDRARMRIVAEPWRPWRAVAARLLWHYYRYGDSGDSTP
jgi:DNA-3-methyladenine glycosylase II